MSVQERLETAGFQLPTPMQLPPNVNLKFPWVRVVGDRALLSGHGPLNPDGSLLQPLGRVGEEVSEEQAYAAARATGLAMLASLQRELGDLERITGWVRLFGMVHAVSSFTNYPSIIDGCTDLLLDLFGNERGAHARSAVAVAGLPFGIPVEIEGEVAFR